MRDAQQGEPVEPGDPVADSHLAVRKRGALVRLPIRAMVFARAAGDYAELHMDDGQVHLHATTLEKLVRCLPSRFERAHRSYVVDLERVDRLVSLEGSRYFLELRGGGRVPVGRTRLPELRRRLGAGTPGEGPSGVGDGRAEVGGSRAGSTRSRRRGYR